MNDFQKQKILNQNGNNAFINSAYLLNSIFDINLVSKYL